MFYVETESELEDWTLNLKKAIGQRMLSDYYVKDDLVGQGSFGKVYKGHSKMDSAEVVAIKYIDKKQMKSFEIAL